MQDMQLCDFLLQGKNTDKEDDVQVTQQCPSLQHQGHNKTLLVPSNQRSGIAQFISSAPGFTEIVQFPFWKGNLHRYM